MIWPAHPHLATDHLQVNLWDTLGEPVVAWARVSIILHHIEHLLMVNLLHPREPTQPTPGSTPRSPMWLVSTKVLQCQDTDTPSTTSRATRCRPTWSRCWPCPSTTPWTWTVRTWRCNIWECRWVQQTEMNIWGILVDVVCFVWSAYENYLSFFSYIVVGKVVTSCFSAQDWWLGWELVSWLETIRHQDEWEDCVQRKWCHLHNQINSSHLTSRSSALNTALLSVASCHNVWNSISKMIYPHFQLLRALDYKYCGEKRCGKLHCRTITVLLYLYDYGLNKQCLTWNLRS